jgi:hypothetical protein
VVGRILLCDRRGRLRGHDQKIHRESRIKPARFTYETEDLVSIPRPFGIPFASRGLLRQSKVDLHKTRPNETAKELAPSPLNDWRA